MGSNAPKVPTKVEAPPTDDLKAQIPEPTNVNDCLDRSQVEAIVRDISPDLKLVSYEISEGASFGDGFSAVILAVEIRVAYPKGEEKELELMVKTLPSGEMRKKFLTEMEAFKKEAKFYTEVLVDCEKFQKQKGIPEKDMFLAYPKCFSSLVDGTQDYIAMENLRVAGYKMANKLVGMDMDHMTLALKNLAKFHAIFYAKFGGDYKAVKSAYPWMKESFFKEEGEETDIMKMFFSMFENVFKMEKDALLKQGLEKDAAALDLLEIDKFLPRMRWTLDAKHPLATVGMGDCWLNNMLFRYDSSGKVITGHKFLDFQICRVGRRTTDLAYMISTSSNLAILTKNEEEMLRIYFDEFVRFGKMLGLKGNDPALDWTIFEEEYNSTRYYGLIMALMITPMMMTKTEDLPDAKVMEKMEQTDEAMKEFFGDMIKGDDLTKKLLGLIRFKLPRALECLKC